MNLEEPKDANERPPEERWLDEALAHYSATEPRLGLENRILANLEARAGERRRRWFYAFAAAAAVLLFAILVTNVRIGKQGTPPNLAGNKPAPAQITPPIPTQNVATDSGSPAAPLVRRNQVLARAKVANRSVVLQADVKQEHFPADQPLSEQDRLLLAYLNRTSPQEMEHVVAVQQELATARQRWEEETSSQEQP